MAPHNVRNNPKLHFASAALSLSIAIFNKSGSAVMRHAYIFIFFENSFLFR